VVLVVRVQAAFLLLESLETMSARSQGWDGTEDTDGRKRVIQRSTAVALDTPSSVPAAVAAGIDSNQHRRTVSGLDACGTICPYQNENRYHRRGYDETYDPGAS